MPEPCIICKSRPQTHGLMCEACRGSYEANRQRIEKKMAPAIQANRDAERITAEDLAIIVT